MELKKMRIIILFAGVIYLGLFIDTILSKQSDKFKFLSFETSKEINLTIFFILSVFLIYKGFKRK